LIPADQFGVEKEKGVDLFGREGNSKLMSAAD